MYFFNYDETRKHLQSQTSEKANCTAQTPARQMHCRRTEWMHDGSWREVGGEVESPKRTSFSSMSLSLFINMLISQYKQKEASLTTTAVRDR